MEPYTDQYMTFDETTHHYVLTPKDATDNLGVNLEDELKTDVLNVLGNFLKQISNHCYNWIHQFNRANSLQDWYIAHTEQGRDIIKRAMEQQLLYVLMNGDLSKSADERERANWFDIQAKEILNEEIIEIGVPITYTGTIPNPRSGQWQAY